MKIDRTTAAILFTLAALAAHSAEPPREFPERPLPDGSGENLHQVPEGRVPTVPAPERGAE